MVATPNFANLVTYWRRFTGDPHHKDLGSYEKSGIHLSSRRVIGKWLKQCGMAPVATREVLYGRAQFLQRASLGLLGSWLASELVIVGRRSKWLTLEN